MLMNTDSSVVTAGGGEVWRQVKEYTGTETWVENIQYGIQMIYCRIVQLKPI